MLNRRKKHEAQHQFDNIVKAAAKGSAQGQSQFRKKNGGKGQKK
jgi:hypothetical protein